MQPMTNGPIGVNSGSVGTSGVVKTFDQSSNDLKKINRKDQPKTDVFEKKDKPEEKSFLQKHSFAIGAAGIIAGPMIAFGGIAAAVLGTTALMMPLILLGGVVGVAGYLTAVTGGFSKK